MEYRELGNKISPVVDFLIKVHVKHRSDLMKMGRFTPKAMNFHNYFHSVLIPLMTVIRRLRKQRLTLVGDERKTSENSVIYACTHIGGHDVENLFEAIKSPCYLFLGDPRELYINFDGILLWLNGVICFETDNKQDRKFAKRRAISLLKSGGSLMIFPEGAWNIYESLPVMPLFWGTADMAIEAGVDIVPVAIERYGSEYCVNIGKNIVVEELNVDKATLTTLLRDELAKLKWQIWESKGIHQRRGLRDTRASFLKRMFNEKSTSFTVEDVLRTRFYPD